MGTIISSGKVLSQNVLYMSKRTEHSIYLLRRQENKWARFTTTQPYQLSTLSNIEVFQELPVTARSFAISHDGQYIFISHPDNFNMYRYRIKETRRNIVAGLTSGAVLDAVYSGVPFVYDNMQFVNEGKKLYCITPHLFSASIHEFDLSVPYDFSTATLKNVVYPYQAARSFHLREEDGKKIIIGRRLPLTGTGTLTGRRYLREYSFGTPYDTSTLIFIAEVDLDALVSGIYEIADIRVSKSGTSIFCVNSYQRLVEKMYLQKPWSISGMTSRVDYYILYPSAGGIPFAKGYMHPEIVRDILI